MSRANRILRNTIAVLIGIVTITITFPIWLVCHVIREMFNWNAYVDWYGSFVDMLLKPIIKLDLKDVQSEIRRETITD